MSLTLRRLDPHLSDDQAAVRRVILGAPRYHQLIAGRAPDETDVQDFLFDRPPGKDEADKFALGVYWEGALSGCVDLIRGYPDPTTAFIGLLLLVEDVQGQGLGPKVVQQIDALALGWGCTRLRLGVIATNAPAFRFWRRVGFVETGARKAISGCVAEAVVMERAVSGS